MNYILDIYWIEPGRNYHVATEYKPTDMVSWQVEHYLNYDQVSNYSLFILYTELSVWSCISEP